MGGYSNYNSMVPATLFNATYLILIHKEFVCEKINKFV